MTQFVLLVLALISAGFTLTLVPYLVFGSPAKGYRCSCLLLMMLFFMSASYLSWSSFDDSLDEYHDYFYPLVAALASGILGGQAFMRFYSRFRMEESTLFDQSQLI